MKYISSAKWFAVVGILSSTSVTWAGEKAGNGGIAVVCRDVQTQVARKARLLDFYELEEYPGFKGKIQIRYSNASVEQQINDALSAFEFDPKLKQELTALASKIRKNMQPIESSKRLVHTNDTDAFVIDGFDRALNCESELENVVVYRRGSGGIWYNREILDLLSKSNTQIAGLVLHEALYQLTERTHQPTSRPARRMVGYLFSDIARPAILKNLAQEFITMPGKYVTVDFDSEHPVILKARFGRMGGRFSAVNSPVALPRDCLKGGWLNPRNQGCDVVLGTPSELKKHEFLDIVDFRLTAKGGTGAVVEYSLEVTQGDQSLRIVPVLHHMRDDVFSRQDRLLLRPFAVYEYLVNDRL